MKRNLLICTALLLLLLVSYSCKKSDSGDSTITYEVKVTSGTWSGSYFDCSNGTQSLKFVNQKPDGWRYSFSVASGKQAGLLISAMPDNSGATVTANIYQGGRLIATDEGSYGANAQFTLNP